MNLFSNSNLKKFLPGLFLLAILFLSTGCPYFSEVPVSGPEYAPPADLIGQWQKEGEEETEDSKPEKLTVNTSDSRNVLTIRRYNAIDLGTEEGGYAEFKGHFSKVGKLWFLNVFDAEKKGYYIYKAEVLESASVVELTEVNENITEEFRNSAELEKFIKDYNHLSIFYNPTSEEYSGLSGKIRYFKTNDRPIAPRTNSGSSGDTGNEK